MELDTKPTEKYSDMGGVDKQIQELEEAIVFPIEKKHLFDAIGIKPPKGVLMYGPPGTGKTMLARAVAARVKATFLKLAGSQLVQSYIGDGAKMVRDAFALAREKAPTIIFIDEIDAIGGARGSYLNAGDSERDQTLNQLLTEMDGFKTDSGIIVIGATNRPEILDKALLRPGRFDRRIIVDKPDLKGRVSILKVHAKDVKLADDVDFDEIALNTSGAVGADLANMINEAAINAAKRSQKNVSQKDLFDAVEVVLVGKEKKDRVLSKEERKIVSYHEIGHALVSALQKHSEPVQKITIVPRTMGALGYVMQTPEEEKYLNTKKELEARLITSLAGRAAEEIVFDTITTGAANDIEEATKLARAMVTQYGMSKKFGVMGLSTRKDIYLTNESVLNCGDKTAALVDDEIKNMLNDAYTQSKKLLTKHRKALDELANYLIEKETITGKEFMEIFTRITGIKPSDKSRISENKKSGSSKSNKNVELEKDNDQTV
jgi:cell division protease FtsH